MQLLHFGKHGLKQLGPRIFLRLAEDGLQLALHFLQTRSASMVPHLLQEVGLPSNLILLTLEALLELRYALVLIEFCNLVLEDSVVSTLPLATAQLLVSF